MENSTHKEILEIVVKHLTLEQRIEIGKELRELAFKKVENLYNSVLKKESNSFYKKILENQIL